MVQTQGVRDGHRLREKIELTVDDRQVAALAVGALLLLAGMFALGLMVGMQIVRRSPQPALAGDLVALDEQRANAQRSAVPRAAAVPEPRPAGPRAPAEPIVSAGAPRPEVAKKEVPPPPTTVSVAAVRPVAVTPEGPAALPEPPADPGKFTVQLGASQDGADAAQLAARAAAVGLKAYVAEARLPGKGVWYRVRVGAFADKESAERFRRDVERELRTSAVVMPTR
jgi:cell division septation protein DedD